MTARASEATLDSDPLAPALDTDGARVAFLGRYEQRPPDANPRLSDPEWDWSFDPADYADEPYHRR